MNYKIEITSEQKWGFNCTIEIDGEIVGTLQLTREQFADMQNKLSKESK